jgi:hypothetical protein
VTVIATSPGSGRSNATGLLAEGDVTGADVAGADVGSLDDNAISARDGSALGAVEPPVSIADDEIAVEGTDAAEHAAHTTVSRTAAASSLTTDEALVTFRL